MKGLQITRPGHFAIVDVPQVDPFPDEVVVAIKAINSCTHWDLTVWDGVDIFGREGHPQYPYTVGGPGHEWAGVVVRTGEQVTTVNVSDRVAYWGSPPGLRPLRTDGRSTGGYVQYTTTHERSVLPFPEGPNARSFREMAMLEMLSCVAQGIVTGGGTAIARAWEPDAEGKGSAVRSHVADVGDRPLRPGSICDLHRDFQLASSGLAVPPLRKTDLGV